MTTIPPNSVSISSSDTDPFNGQNSSSKAPSKSCLKPPRNPQTNRRVSFSEVSNDQKFRGDSTSLDPSTLSKAPLKDPSEPTGQESVNVNGEGWIDECRKRQSERRFVYVTHDSVIGYSPSNDPKIDSSTHDSTMEKVKKYSCTIL